MMPVRPISCVCAVALLAGCVSLPNPFEREETIGDVVVEEVKDVGQPERRFSLNPFGGDNDDEPEVTDEQVQSSGGFFGLFAKQEGDAETNEVLRNRAWRQIIRHSDTQPITDDTMRVDVTGSFTTDPKKLDYVLLARASGEALKRGYPEFAITHIEYSGGQGLTSMLVPNVSFAERTWIGTYSDLLIAKDNQNVLGEMGKYGFKSVEAVVVFRQAGEERRRETFPAAQTYINMLNSRLDLDES